MATFTWIPEYGAALDVKPAVIRAKFGEGYEQRMQDGINNKPREWSLTFVKTPSEVDNIEAFLAAEAGASSFDWTPQRGIAGKWVCDSWKRTATNPAYDTLTCSFREVFGE